MVKEIGNPAVDREMLSTIFVNFCVGTCIYLVFKALGGLPVYDVRRRLRHSRDMNTIPNKGSDGFPVKRQLFYFGRWPLSMEDELQQVIGLDGVVAVRFSWLCFKFCAVYSVVAVFLCAWFCLRPESESERETSFSMRSFQISHSRNVATAEIAMVASWIMSALVIVLIELEYRQFCLLRRSYFRGKFRLRREEENHWKAHFQRTVLVKNVNLKGGTFSHSEIRRRMEHVFRAPRTAGTGRTAVEAVVEEVVLCSDTSKLRTAVDVYDSLAEDKKALAYAGRHGCCLALGDVAFQFGPRRLVNRIPMLVRLGIMKKPTTTRISEARAAVRYEYEQLVGRVGTDEGDPPRPAPTPSQLWVSESDSETSAKPDDNPTIETALKFSWREIRTAVTSAFHKEKSENYAFVTFRTRFTQALSVQMVLQNMVAARAPYPSDVVWPNMTVSDTRTYLRQFWTIVAMLLGIVVLSVLCAAIQAWANVELIHKGLVELLPFTCMIVDPILRGLEDQRVAINGQLASLALIGVLFVVPPLVRSFLMWYDGVKFKSTIMKTSVKVCFMYSLVALYASTFTGGYLMEDAGGVLNRTASVLDGAKDASGPLAATGQILGFTDAIGSPLAMMQEILGLAAKGMDNVSPYFMEFIITKLGVRLALYLLRPYVLVPWCAHKALGWFVARRRRGGDSSRTAVGSREPGQGLLRESSFSSSSPEEDEGDAVDEEAEWQPKAHEKPAGEAVEQQILQESPFYDWLLVDLVVVLALCFMYGVMAPLIILPSMVFFWVYGSMIHFNFLFIYTQEFDTGGEFFFDLVDMTFSALVLSQLLLQTYIFSEPAERGGAHPIMLPMLTLIVMYTWRIMHISHEPECRALSLEQCKRDDRRRKRESQRVPAAPCREGAPAYVDPLVLRARNIARGGDLKLEWTCSSFQQHDPGEGEEAGAQADSDDGTSSSSLED